MDAQQFLVEFKHILNAPGGIQQLREMIYQLAITGTLTSQLGEDGDVSLLLAEIASLKEKLISNKTYKRLPKLENQLSDIPTTIKLPMSWRWTRLLDIGEISPKNYAVDEVPAHFIPMSGFSELHMGKLVLITEPWGKIKKGFTHFANGDVVVAKITPCFENGKAAVIEGLKHSIGAGTTELHVFRPIHAGVLPAYVYLFLRSPYFTIEGEKNMTGTAGQKRLTTEYFATRALPLPPTAEQARIVAKVDELMILCDKLEKQYQVLRKLQKALRQSTLQAVGSASNPDELQTAWACLAKNFAQLFSSPEDADDLRKMLLDLAVSGYMSIPKESDESASELKRKILVTKERGILEGIFSRKKQIKPEELKDTILPPHWRSITLDDAISTIDAGWSPACLPNTRDDENTWGVLKTTSVQVLQFFPQEHKELPVSLDPRPQYQIKVGDILITRAGPKNRVGICCVVDSAPPKLMISDKLIRFHIVDDLIAPHFIALCLSAGEPGRIVEMMKSGMADSQMNISQDKLRSVTIPLPPIEEQLRILNAIDVFMKMLDIYSEQLHKSKRIATLFSAVAVSVLTGLTPLQEKDEPMKAPQTKLIAWVRLGTSPDIKAQAPLATILARHNGEMSAKDLWQRFSGEIDAFYAQMKLEVANGWLQEPTGAEMREEQTDTVNH